MQMRTFEAINMKEAIKAIKSELGNDAVILSTKDKAIKGSDAKGVEVTAVAASSQKNTQRSNSGESFAGMQFYNQQISALDQKINSLLEKIPSKQSLSSIDSNISNLNLLLNNYLKMEKMPLPDDAPEGVIEVYKQLSLMGIEEAYLTKLLQHLLGLPLPKSDSKSDDYYKTHAMRWMMRRISIAPPIHFQDNPTQVVHAFIGKSSSGKTSSICKLANIIATKQRDSLVIASIDSSKLGGNELLRVYAKLLSIKYKEFNSVDEFIEDSLLANHRGIILLDTPSHISSGDSLTDALLNLKSSNILIDFHLCLSTTEKQIHMDKSVGQFSPLGIKTLVFTKIDEAWSFGELFNIPQKWSLPISHFSFGQNIPEDFEDATRERVLSRIFNI
jgi:flagellar biosynthesis protein FlhF